MDIFGSQFIHVTLVPVRLFSASKAVTRKHFTCEQAYSGKEIEILHVNIYIAPRRIKSPFFTSKTVFFIESFCTELRTRTDFGKKNF